MAVEIKDSNFQEIVLDSDKPVTVYYFEIPDAQNPDPQQTAFQTFQNFQRNLVPKN